MQDLFLRHVALHLLRKGHDPAEHVLPVFAVRVDAARHVDAFDGAALRFAAAVAAEHPAVALFAFVEGELFFMLHPARIVVLQGVPRLPPLFLALDREQAAHDRFLTHMTNSVPILPLFQLFPQACIL